MVTRKEKRLAETDKNYFFEFIKIQRHFFKDLQLHLSRVQDPRHQSYITYRTELLLLMILLKNACNLTSMRSMTNQFNKEACIENLRKLTGLETLEELPHYDTINNFLTQLPPEELEEIRTYMIKELFKKRCFENYRINGKYWGIIFDGTGLFSFDKKHCEHCLKRVFTNKATGEKKTVYMHHVLEAKLVVGHMVLSIGSEFIENESEDVTNQDCELKAFHRLAKTIKSTYKRLPICILGDSLYACEGVFSLCKTHRWKYIFRFKEGRIPSIAKEFETLKNIEQGNQLATISWVNDISYNEHTLNVLEYRLDKTEKASEKVFTFITDLKIKKKNCKQLIEVGRSRWRIENEGFNRQKHIRFHIEHVNSQNYIAMKNHYLLIQITDIILQLFERGLPILKQIKKTAKEISSNLLEAIRTRKLTVEDTQALAKPIQVRFT